MVFCIKFLILVSSKNFYHNLLFFYILVKLNLKILNFRKASRAKFAQIAKTGVGDPSAAANAYFNLGGGWPKSHLISPSISQLLP